MEQSVSPLYKQKLVLDGVSYRFNVSSFLPSLPENRNPCDSYFLSGLLTLLLPPLMDTVWLFW